MTAWLISVVALIVGLLLVLGGRGIRRLRGLGEGQTPDLDGRTLYSRRYGLSGGPDRIIEGDIPEKWKSARRVYDSHRAQMGVYLILLEEETGVRLPHGFIVTGDGAQHRIENTDELRAWVLGVATRSGRLGVRWPRNHPGEPETRPVPVVRSERELRSEGGVN